MRSMSQVKSTKKERCTKVKANDNPKDAFGFQLQLRELGEVMLEYNQIIRYPEIYIKFK